LTLLDGIYAQTPIDTRDVPPDVLNLPVRQRTNPLAWNGQFSPQLVEILLHHYARESQHILDPFVGSGTVLLEAGLLGKQATGVEINPAAVALSRVYEFINVPIPDRRIALSAVENTLRSSLGHSGPLFGEAASPGERVVSAALLAAWRETTDWRESVVLRALVLLSQVSREGGSQDRAWRTWHRLAKLVLKLPHSNLPIRVVHADARAIGLPSEGIDLVLTSPPYINVFNYHQQYRPSEELLRSWSLLEVARSEIGSNRKHRGNRYLTVIQYCLDMAQVLEELSRVMRPTARMILIVGRESSVRGTRFFNGELVAELAHRALSYRLLLRQERVYTNRFGQIIYEDILHFDGGKTLHKGDDVQSIARGVAVQALSASRVYAPVRERMGLDEAVAWADDVRPSPIFDTSRAAQQEPELHQGSR